jgi:signal transduction histidine kinase
MIKQARIRLTILYSAIFLVLFWSLSFGIYVWMNNFFGDQGRIHFGPSNLIDTDTHNFIRGDTPSDIIMDNLRNILLMIDGVLLVMIPVITWLLTGNALKPVQEAHKRERQFLTDASHELRTPLSILRAEMEVALKKKQSLAEYEKVIRSSIEEVEELIALVENLLFMSREQTRHSSPINEKIDLTDLTAEQVAGFQQKAKQKKLTLTFRPPEKETIILGNQQLLKRLLTNLLDNAIKYTKRGGITITIKQTKEKASVTIADTGIGIPKIQLEKIFDRFYRADSSRTEKGYGLGLSIAKQIVAVHHGEITVKSSPKKGTTMQVSFPLLD